MTNIDPEINESEHQDASSDVKIARVPIKGWLLFFLIVLGLGALLGLFLWFYVFALSYHSGILSVKGYFLETLIDSFELLAYTGLVAYTIISFFRNKPNSVSLARMCLVSAIMTGLFFCISEIADFTSPATLRVIFRSLVMSCVWLIFLRDSKQVKRLFPKPSRRIKGIDIFIFLLTWLPGYLYFLITSLMSDMA